VAFTKIDRLEFKEKKRLKKMYVEMGMDVKQALDRAKTECVVTAAAEYNKYCVEILESDLVPPAWTRYCPVSYKREPTSLQRLTLCI